MREILFRGKRVSNGEWVEGSLIKAKAENNKDVLYLIAPFTMSAFDVQEVTPETVGQYTGLTDKNGQKIFEGDILKNVMRWCEEERNGLVTFKDGAFGFIWHRGEVKMFHAFASVVNIEYEVIGSVFDNPELLYDE